MDFNPSNLPLDFEKGFTLPFDLKTGMSTIETGKRRLSAMKGILEQAAYTGAPLGEANQMAEDAAGAIENAAENVKDGAENAVQNATDAVTNP